MVTQSPSLTPGGLTSPSGLDTAKAAASAAKPAGQSFADMVGQLAKDGVTAGLEAEKQSAQAIAGQGDINQVVLAVTSAELTLQTVVAVRDKVVQSYQDIMRMPI